MLPDYPKVKAEIWKAYADFINRSREQRLGKFSEIRVTVMHEGFSETTTHPDGSISELVLDNHAGSATINAPPHDIDSLTFHDIEKTLAELGSSMADGQASSIIGKMIETTNSIGNVVRGPIDAVEATFQLMEKRSFDFDMSGQPRLGDIYVGHPEDAEKFRLAQEKIMSTPELRARLEELFEKKRGEFLDREAARKLVD